MNIFKDKTEAMPKEPEGPDSFVMVSTERRESPLTVHVTMTPAQERALRMSNYPRYDWLDVHHPARPKLGHHY